MLKDRTASFLRAFEKYVDARIEYVIGQREARAPRLEGAPRDDRELAAKQHRSDLALNAIGVALERTA